VVLLVLFEVAVEPVEPPVPVVLSAAVLPALLPESAALQILPIQTVSGFSALPKWRTPSSEAPLELVALQILPMQAVAGLEVPIE